LAIRSVELHAHPRQAVDVGRLDLRVPVTAQVVVHVIHGDEKNIELGLGGAGHQRGAGEKEKENEKTLDTLHDLARWKKLIVRDHS
jgi:hypothetical protein